MWFKELFNQTRIRDPRDVRGLATVRSGGIQRKEILFYVLGSYFEVILERVLFKMLGNVNKYIFMTVAKQAYIKRITCSKLNFAEKHEYRVPTSLGLLLNTK